MIDPPQDPALGAPIARAERRLALLGEMADIGMDKLRALKPDVTEEAAKAYAALTRAIRLTLVLEAKVDRELAEIRAGVVPKTADEMWNARVQRQTAVSRLVVGAADRECETEGEFVDLCRALDERLEEDEAYIGIQHRPLRETVERLCKDLTLTPDWSRWDDDGWVDDAPPPRPAYSIFGTPSARPRRHGPDGAPLETPAPPHTLRRHLE